VAPRFLENFASLGYNAFDYSVIYLKLFHVHPADLSVLKPWGGVSCGEGGGSYSSFHSLYGGIYLLFPPPLLVHVNHRKGFVTANVAVERMGIGLKGAYRETPEKLRDILRGLIHRIPYCALLFFLT
jgi:hypothetical protein